MHSSFHSPHCIILWLKLVSLQTVMSLGSSCETSPSDRRCSTLPLHAASRSHDWHVQVGDGVFEVLSTSGDTHLGGDDFDKRIVDFMADDFKRAEGMDLRKDRQACP